MKKSKHKEHNASVVKEEKSNTASTKTTTKVKKEEGVESG